MAGHRRVRFHPEAALEYEALSAEIEGTSDTALYDDLTSLMGYALYLDEHGEHGLMTSFRMPRLSPPRGPWPSQRPVCYRVEGDLALAFVYKAQADQFMVLAIGRKADVFRRYPTVVIDRALELLKEGTSP